MRMELVRREMRRDAPLTVGRFALIAAGTLLLMLAVTLEAQQSITVPAVTKEKTKALNQHGNLAQTSLANYLERVKAETQETRASRFK